MFWFRVGLICGWILLRLASPTHGQLVSSSYVAGYERFASHGDVDSLQSSSLLVRELSCTACHPADQAWLKPKRGPQLDDVATRLSVEWIEAFLSDPIKVAPGTTMPNVLVQLRDEERPDVVRSLVAFLSTLRSALPEIKGSGLLPVPHEFWKHGDAHRGQQLFHQVGCVACHSPASVDDQQSDHSSQGDAIPSDPSRANTDQQQGVVGQQSATALDNLMESLDAEQLAEMGLTNAARPFPSAPLTNVDRKYGAESLTHFLLDPLRWRAAGRMPNLKLSPVEAADIAAYLMMRGSGRTDASLRLTDRNGRADSAYDTDQEVAKGRTWYLKLGCGQCHSAAGVAAEVVAKPLSSLNMTGNGLCRDRNGRPQVQYALTDAQKETIAALVPKLRGEVPWSSADSLTAQLLSFNCLACHVRDGLGGVGRYRREYFGTAGNVDLGDEGRFPPPLDRIGRKLQPGWLKNVLLGRKADIRPHLQIRMPVFSLESAQSLSDLLIAVDGPPNERAGIDNVRLEGASLAQAIDAGKQLMDTACVQCHVFKGQALPGVAGVDIVGLENRLRPEWFHAFLRDPGQLKPRTRMPTFFTDGKSPRPDLLHGNVDLQIDAMWTYLNSKEFALPARIQEARDRDFELRPGAKPIIVRTFVEGVGFHAIAVGYPSGVHLAFDAQRMQVALGWKGRFMDAQGTWFSRFAPPAAPLGDRTVQLMSRLPIGTLEGPDDEWPKEPVEYRFLGYKIDPHGVPTFRYRCGQVDFEDRCDTDSEGLIRQLRLDNLAKQSIPRSYLLLHSGANLKMLDAQTAIDDKGVAVSVKLPSHAGTTEERHVSETRLWLLPITLTVTELELRYRW